MGTTARAHPNIALSKYWGKLPEGTNLPAVPSLSVTLAGMNTRTEVRFDAALSEDAFELDGRARDGRPLEFLGSYDPKTNPEQLTLRTEAIEAWVRKGARLSPTVKSLMRRARAQQASAGSAS